MIRKLRRTVDALIVGGMQINEEQAKKYGVDAAELERARKIGRSN
jgi:hypothetical protein